MSCILIMTQERTGSAATGWRAADAAFKAEHHGRSQPNNVWVSPKDRWVDGKHTDPDGGN